VVGVKHQHFTARKEPALGARLDGPSSGMQDEEKSSICTSGFGDLVVSMLASGTQDREAVGFYLRKNPQHAFLRRGSKAVRPMSQICGILKKPVIYVGVGITGQINRPFLAHNSVLH
jgi:hypothetical protein